MSSITRKLFRRAQASVEAKLSKAATSLRNFLEDDLSEANIGLTAGCRAHLERFRTFLLAFYAHRLGYYPPSPVHTGNGMWDPEIYRVMRADFEALYEFLVDRTFTTTDSASFLGQGGICALQSVHAFDLRHRYRSLRHPLSRLPEVTSSTGSKRTSWFGKSESNLRPDRRLVAHVALIKATNNLAPHLMRNSLVAAYRTFEEDSLCSQIKFDKIEKLSQGDARKIRWILIYGVYQTLRSCTDAPSEVSDPNSVGYSLAISTSHLPPWKEKRDPSLLRTRSKISVMSPVPSVPSSGASTPGMSSDIKPDIDYCALSRRDNHNAAPSRLMPPFQIPPRSGSLRNVLSRTGSLRKSLGSLRAESRTAPAIEPHGQRRNVAYHEMAMRGYGNETNEVHVGNKGSVSNLLQTGARANRSPSTSSNSSAGSSAKASDASQPSEESWGSGNTSIPDATPLDKAPGMRVDARRASVASNHTTTSSVYSTPDEPACPPVPRRNSKRKSLLIHFDPQDCDTPAPLQIRKGGRLALPVDDDAEQWRAIEYDVDERCGAVPAGRLVRTDGLGDGDIPEWDSFADVGGLTDFASS